MEWTPAGKSPDDLIVPNVPNEFGTLQTAVITARSAPEVLATINDATVEEALEHFDPDMILHFAFVQLLRDRAVRLLYPHHPNRELTYETVEDYIGEDTFCHDFLGVVNDRAILSNVISFRNKNRLHYESLLKRMPRNKVSTTDDSFSWGNALLCNGKLLVGVEHNQYFEDVMPPVSTPEKFSLILHLYDDRLRGMQSIREILTETGSTCPLVTVAKNCIDDLDCALAPLPRTKRGGKRAAFVQETSLHPASLEVLDKEFDILIPVQDDPSVMGCNILWLDPETPVLGKEAKHTAAMLRQLGFNATTFPLGTLTAVEDPSYTKSGGWRCMTGVLERKNDYVFG